MKNRVIAFLESRLADHVAELVVRRGGIAVSAPALAEEPDLDPAAIGTLIDVWSRRPPRLVIFQTGVGTRALFAATDALGITTTLLALLANSAVAARGPKPTSVLRQRGVRIDHSAAEPYTTAEVLAAIAAIDLTGQTVAVQRYGDTNTILNDALVARGASVVEVPTYRWALPADTRPLVALMDRLDRREVDVVAFTSASQVHNLFAIAQRESRTDALRAALKDTLIASIGPVCSAALRDAAIAVDVEAQPPKLGPLLEAIDAALAAP